MGDHGLALNDQLTVRIDAGGTLPAPLAAEVTYFAKPVNAQRFQVSATSGGAAIDLTTAGAHFVVVVPIQYAAAISYASRLIDEMLVGHVLLQTGDPVPEIIRITCAEIAVGKLAAISGSVSKSLGEIVDTARKRLEQWGKGRPLRAANKPAPANVSVSATAPFRDARGWNNCGKIG